MALMNELTGGQDQQCIYELICSRLKTDLLDVELLCQLLENAARVFQTGRNGHGIQLQDLLDRTALGRGKAAPWAVTAIERQPGKGADVEGTARAAKGLTRQDQCQIGWIKNIRITIDGPVVATVPDIIDAEGGSFFYGKRRESDSLYLFQPELDDVREKIQFTGQAFLK